ncbi:MAG TPA: hypothetical protein VGP78_12350 [Solirubrobacteraceae bacterium]|nr:hypothetical protein [Solirubrobacteraceae bacterium]
MGFATALLAARPVVGIAGFACLGAGMSTVVPIVFRAAGAVPGLAAGLGLAAVTSMSYLGFLVGPPLIGGIAELTGLPAALVLLVGLAVAVVTLAPVTRPSAAVRAASPARAAA